MPPFSCHIVLYITSHHTAQLAHGVSHFVRFVEALWASGRPATALAVQRARCAGGGASSSGGGSFDGSSSLREAQVLLRVQLGCGLLAEGFCDARRHCSQVCECAWVSERAAHEHLSTCIWCFGVCMCVDVDKDRISPADAFDAWLGG